VLTAFAHAEVQQQQQQQALALASEANWSTSGVATTAPQNGLVNRMLHDSAQIPQEPFPAPSFSSSLVPIVTHSTHATGVPSSPSGASGWSMPAPPDLRQLSPPASSFDTALASEPCLVGAHKVAVDGDTAEGEGTRSVSFEMLSLNTLPSGAPLANAVKLGSGSHEGGASSSSSRAGAARSPWPSASFGDVLADQGRSTPCFEATGEPHPPVLAGISDGGRPRQDALTVSQFDMGSSITAGGAGVASGGAPSPGGVGEEDSVTFPTVFVRPSGSASVTSDGPLMVLDVNAAPTSSHSVGPPTPALLASDHPGEHTSASSSIFVTLDEPPPGLLTTLHVPPECGAPLHVYTSAAPAPQLHGSAPASPTADGGPAHAKGHVAFSGRSVVSGLDLDAGGASVDVDALLEDMQLQVCRAPCRAYCAVHARRLQPVPSSRHCAQPLRKNHALTCLGPA
jgi:hypothetical protein